MSSVLDFNGASRRREFRPQPILRGDDVGEFWLDVARHESDAPVAVETIHSPKQVLSEALAVLAGAALLALAVTLLVPGPTF